jgi:purine-binding chemotaxis protein CheW
MPKQFVIVSVALRKRLIRLEEVREIVPLMALAEVEGRRGLCRGMVNLRGQMIPVFDLAGPDARLSPSRVIVVTRMSNENVGLLVDEK